MYRKKGTSLSGQCNPEGWDDIGRGDLVRPEEIGLRECRGCDRLVEEDTLVRGYGACCYQVVETEGDEYYGQDDEVFHAEETRE
jgi:hypothetical protein